MGNTRSSKHASIDWLAKGPLAPHIDEFMLYLANRDYAANTFCNYLGVVSHFAQWMHSRRLRLQSIDEALVAKFIDQHLPRCHCSGPVQRDRRTLSAALGHLLAVLRAQGAIAPVMVRSKPVDEELRRYDAYMDHVRGLAPKTRETALRILGRLLTARFGDEAIDIAALEPDQVRDFFAQQAKLYSKPASAGTVIASLRGYFRYRVSLGDAVQGLIGVLSYPANWQLSSLPKTLTPEEVEQLVNSLGKQGRSLRRADAIVRCALDLGLRSGEIAHISLDDIDWRAGTITLRHTKGRRDDVLPLPATTGAAIVAYLEQERPKTRNRAVFVRHQTPRGEPVGPDLVRKAIRQAFAHAGLPYTRSHLLRHSMANRLLAGGASLKEVADVLRHRSLNTTMIYAKLDSRNLAEVALAWPGSAA
ncbi:MAG: tyrosine-type recombinase/integrase [Propionivibrio sp.]|jgi:integrase/recombinase XerC|nr:tyrosine-type recombinase/integrase [Thauera sp.]MBP8277888.1 tyrosine-type recombinase/integrase [Propionivibrio sp.]HNS94274.1 site-specific integrase [Thauera sp.]